jgi:hypothetical protein
VSNSKSKLSEFDKARPSKVHYPIATQIEKELKNMFEKNKNFNKEAEKLYSAKKPIVKSAKAREKFLSGKKSNSTKKKNPTPVAQVFENNDILQIWKD